MHLTSTTKINAIYHLPKHIAMIMDGNGRWAQRRGLPRITGHQAGVKTLHNVIEICLRKKIEVLTVYAFSSENWKRPKAEIKFLMELLITSLQQQLDELHNHNICLRFIGDLSAFSDKLRAAITVAEKLTCKNTAITVVIAVNYGGRWDISHAMKQICHKVLNGEISLEDMNEDIVGRYVQLAELPAPDLFIRTGGEMRVSNYLLWQLAYTELYFDNCLWPDFGEANFAAALDVYSKRERRFGQLSEQLKHA